MDRSFLRPRVMSGGVSDGLACAVSGAVQGLNQGWRMMEVPGEAGWEEGLAWRRII